MTPPAFICSRVCTAKSRRIVVAGLLAARSIADSRPKCRRRAAARSTASVRWCSFGDMLRRGRLSRHVTFIARVSARLSGHRWHHRRVPDGGLSPRPPSQTPPADRERLCRLFVATRVRMATGRDATTFVLFPKERGRSATAKIRKSVSRKSANRRLRRVQNFHPSTNAVRRRVKWIFFFRIYFHIINDHFLRYDFRVDLTLLSSFHCTRRQIAKR